MDDTQLVDDLDASVDAACAALASVLDRDWSVLATGSIWSARAVVVHVADDFLQYATAVAGRRTPPDVFVPLHYWGDPAVEDESAVHADPDTDNLGVLRVLDACAGLLSAAVRVAPADHRGFHPYGVSDPAGFAAMGTVEVLLHLHDLAAPLGLAWDPDPSVVRRVLERLFPDAPDGADPWPALLRLTGRDPEHPLESWRWDGRPAAERG